MDVSAADLGAGVALPPELDSDDFAVSPALDFPASELPADGFLELLAAFSCGFASLILVSLRCANFLFVLYQFFANIHKISADKFDVQCGNTVTATPSKRALRSARERPLAERTDGHQIDRVLQLLRLPSAIRGRCNAPRGCPCSCAQTGD